MLRIGPIICLVRYIKIDTLELINSMLLCQLTPKGLGLIIYGDYQDLTFLRTIIWESIPDEEDTNGLNTYLLAFCYDLRKAVNGYGPSIEVEAFPLVDGTFKTELYRSAKLTWPAFLYSLNMLVQLSSLKPGNVELEATIYQLRAIAFSALKERFPIDDELLLALMSFLPRYVQKPIARQLVQTAEATLLDKVTDKERFFALPYVMSMLVAGTPAYQQVISDLEKAAKHHGCSINALELAVEYDDDDW